MELSITKVNSEFTAKVEEIANQSVYRCYQCGECSSSCPMVEQMDIMPNQIMKLLQMGEDDKIKNANTAYICASCFQCSVRCPRGVRITEIMEAIRLVKLRSNEDHFNLDHLSREELKRLPQIAVVSNLRKLSR